MLMQKVRLTKVFEFEESKHPGGKGQRPATENLCSVKMNGKWGKFEGHGLSVNKKGAKEEACRDMMRNMPEIALYVNP